MITDEEKLEKFMVMVQHDRHAASHNLILMEVAGILAKDYLNRAKKGRSTHPTLDNPTVQPTVTLIDAGDLGVLVSNLKRNVENAFRKANSIESYTDLIYEAFEEFRKGIEKQMDKK